MNQKSHISQVEPRNRRKSSMYILSSCLHLLSLLLPDWTHCQHPVKSRHHVTCTIQHLSFQNTPNNLHNFVHSLLAVFRHIQMYHNANASDVDSFSTCGDGPKGQPQRKWKANWQGQNANIGYKLMLVIGLGLNEGIHLGTDPWTQMDIQCLQYQGWEGMGTIYDIIFFDLVSICHFSQFQQMWPCRRSRCFAFQERWVAFDSYMWQMFDKTHDQMNNWRWDKAQTFGHEIDRSNQ